MDTEEIKIDIERKLLSLRYSKRVGPNQLALRCMFCGDSKKDPKKTRFYVQINKNKNAPILYNCFNCGVSGILTPSVLRTFEINDLSLNSALVHYNNTSIKNTNELMNHRKKKLKFKPNMPNPTKLNAVKKLYIEKRLGIKIPLSELILLKTVFSLEEFLVYNKIDEVNAKKDRANDINDNYVGFLSSNNEYIVFRDVTGKGNRRYDKYQIIPNMENSNKFYTIPNTIDILSTEPININLAEGVFDILGVYYHIRDKKLKNEIYAAICDSGYSTVIKYFLSQGIIGKNVTINIFSDSDHGPYFYYNIFKEFSKLVGCINLYYNDKSKDFGVDKDSISLIRKPMPRVK